VQRRSAAKVEEELDLPGWTGKAQDLCGPERKRRIRDMRQDGGVKYFDVTPGMSVTGAGFVGLCYVALRAVFRQIVPNRVIKYQ
jgi:hypothetical protein